MREATVTLTSTSRAMLRSTYLANGGTPSVTTDGNLSRLKVERVFRGNESIAKDVPFPAAELAARVGRIAGAAHIGVEMTYEGDGLAEVWLDVR